MRAAASSIASGSPSSRTHISATAGALSLVTSKSALTGGPLDEQAHRLVLGQPLQGRQTAGHRAGIEEAPRTRALPLILQGHSAGHQHLQVGQAGKQLAHLGSSVDHLLEVVQHQQQVLSLR